MPNDPLEDLFDKPAPTPRRRRNYDPDSALNLIEKYESGGRNVPNYRYDRGHTAQGYHQITNTNWRNYGPRAGVDLKRYPSAMAAPKEVQSSVAKLMYNERGFKDWAPYNPRLRAAINRGEQVQSAKPAPSPDLSDLMDKDPLGDLFDKDSGQTPPPAKPQSSKPRRTSRAPSAPKPEPYSGTGRAFDIYREKSPQPSAPAMSARTPSVWERLKETVSPYVPGLATLDTPFGVKTDPLRGAVSGITLGAAGDPRQVSAEERIIDPDAQAKADLAHQIGSIAPAVVPYIGATRAAGAIPALRGAGRLASAARTGIAFGGVEAAREGIRSVRTGEPVSAANIAVSTAVGAAMGAIPGVNPSWKRTIVAAVGPQIAADAARGVPMEEAAKNAVINLLFGVHEATGRPSRVPAGRIKEIRAQLRQERQNAPQVQTQPDVAAQPEAAEPAVAASETTAPIRPIQEQVADVETPAQRFYHKQYGEVEVIPDQTGAGKNRYRVQEVDNPDVQHFVKKADLRGRGNERMVPIKSEPVAEETPPFEERRGPKRVPQMDWLDMSEAERDKIRQGIELEGVPEQKPLHPILEGESPEAIATQQVGRIKPEVKREIDDYLSENGLDIEDVTSDADTRQHRDFTLETAEEIQARLQQTGRNISLDEVTDALYALRHEAIPSEIEATPEPVKPVEQGATHRSYDEVQRDIDDLETRLENEGADVLRLYDAADPENKFLPPDWKPMPDELARLYRERDAIGASELGQNIQELTGRLKSIGLNDQEVKNVLDRVAIRGTDAFSQTQAADYAQYYAGLPARELTEKLYFALADARKTDLRAIDSIEDVGRYGERKTLEDAAKAARAIKTYFAGEPLPEQSRIAGEKPDIEQNLEPPVEQGDAALKSPKTTALGEQSLEELGLANKSWREVVDSPQLSDNLMRRHSILREVARTGTDQEKSDVLDRIEGEKYGDASNIAYDIAHSPKTSQAIRDRAQSMRDAIYPPITAEERTGMDRERWQRRLEETEQENEQLRGQKGKGVKQQIINNERFIAELKAKLAAKAPVERAPETKPSEQRVPEPSAVPVSKPIRATSQESEVRLLLRAARGPELTAKVIFRPVGSNQAVVEILGQRFTIDNSRRLVDAGVRLDSSEKQTTLKGKRGKDVTDFFSQYPKLSAEDFSLRRPRPESPSTPVSEVPKPQKYPWQMTREEFLATRPKEQSETSGIKAHKKAIRAAQKAKEAIPVEVYDDYPDLKPAEYNAYGVRTDRPIEDFIFRGGGIVWTKNDAGELRRLIESPGGLRLLNNKNRQGAERITAEIMMQRANDAGFRDPQTGQPFDNPGNFLRAVEASLTGEKLYPQSGEQFGSMSDAEFARQEAEYYAKQEADENAREARTTFLESGRGAELFDKIVEGKATDAERAEYIDLAKRAGIDESEAQYIVDNAAEDFRGEMEAVPSTSVQESRPTEPTKELPLSRAPNSDNLNPDPERAKWGHLADDDPGVIQAMHRVADANPEAKRLLEAVANGGRVVRRGSKFFIRDKGGEVIGLIDNATGGLNVFVDVPLERIEMGETAERGMPQDFKKVERYAALSTKPPLISAHGPRFEGDTYQVINGHHRVLAAKKRGAKTIRASASVVDEKGNLLTVPKAGQESGIPDYAARFEAAAKTYGKQESGIPEPSQAEIDATLAEMEKPAYQRRLEAKRKDPEYRKHLEAIGLTPDEIRIHLTPRSELNDVERAVKREIRSRVIKANLSGTEQALSDLVEDTLSTATEFNRKQQEAAAPLRRIAEQPGLMEEGLTPPEGPRPKTTDQREALLQAEQERQAELNPERTAALAKLEELRRRGLTIDDYARQPDLTGRLPDESELAQLREVESGKSQDLATQEGLFEQPPIERIRRERPSEGGFATLGRHPHRRVGPVLKEVERTVQLEPPSRSRKLLAGIKGLPARLQTALTAEFTPMRKLEEKVRTERPLVDMARKFEQVAGAPAKAEADFIDFKKAVVDPIRQDVDDFNSYLFLKRVEDRLTQDPDVKRVSDWTIDKAQQGLKELEDAVGPETMREFERIGDVYQAEMRKALQLQVDSGRMSQDLFDKIVKSNDFYAPFKVLKYIEEGESRAGSGRNIATTQELTKKIVGIDSADFQVGNLLQASAEQIMRSRVLAEKNLKMQDLAKLADEAKNSEIVKVAPDAHPRKGFEVVRYYENGKVQGLEVDADVAKAIRGMNATQASVTAKAAQVARRGLQWGATSANAGFQAVNLFFADLPRQALISRYGVRSIKDIYQFPMDWAYSLATSVKGNFGKPNELFMDWLRSGAANSTVQRELTPEVFRPKPISPGRTHPLKRALYSIAEFSNAIEETSKILGLRRGMRIENFKNLSPDAQREAMEKIAAEVRNFSGSPDFLRKGTETRNLNLLFMFFNARLQGTASDLSRLAGKSGKKEGVAAWARLGAAVGVPATVLAIINHLPDNKDDYDQIPDWEKKNYFMIPRSTYFTNEDGQQVRDYWRVPKRDVVGLFGNSIESFVDFAYKRDPKAFRDLASNMVEGLSPINIEGNDLKERGESVLGSMNPAFKVPAEVLSNRDFFRKRDIVPEYMKKASPGEQFRESTPIGYRKAGQLLGVSPLRIQHAAEGFTGGFAGQFNMRKPREGAPAITGLPVVGAAARRFIRSGAVREDRSAGGIEQGVADKQLQRQRLRNEILTRMRKGETVDLDSYVQRGDLTETDRDSIEKDAPLSRRQARFVDLPPTTALDRYSRMSAAQKQEVNDLMARKAYSLLHSDALTEAQKESFQKKINELGIEPKPPERKSKNEFGAGFKSKFKSKF